MENLAGYLLSAVLLVAGFVTVSAQEEAKYMKNGDTLTVKPSPVSGNITSITWKHNGNFVAEWIDGKVELNYYGLFKGRTTMDTTTGSLEIRNVGPADSGVLSVEINNNVQSKTYNVKLIQPVSKPDVSIKPLGCHAESKSCTLVCGGNAKEVEPVTYSWNLGGDKWENGEKDRTIINDETTQSVEEFSCRMKNPISEDTSEPKPNLFYRAPGSIGSGGIAGIVIVVLLVVGVVLVVVGVKYYKGQWIWNMGGLWLRRSNPTSNGNCNETYVVVSQQDDVQQESTAGPGPAANPEPAENPEPAAGPGPAANPEPAAGPGPMESGPAASPEPVADPEPAAGPGSMESGPAASPEPAAGPGLMESGPATDPESATGPGADPGNA